MIAYLALDINPRELIHATFGTRRRIVGVMALRRLLELGLLEARLLWEHLEAITPIRPVWSN